MAIYRGVFWTYERGTWQYDVMVALILAFIFFTPRSWFNDQPRLRTTKATDVVLLVDDPSIKVYQLQAAMIDERNPSGLEQQIRRVLNGITNKPIEITRIEPAKSSSGEIVSYAVWVRE